MNRAFITIKPTVYTKPNDQLEPIKYKPHENSAHHRVFELTIVKQFTIQILFLVSQIITRFHYFRLLPTYRKEGLEIPRNIPSQLSYAAVNRGSRGGENS